MTNTPSTIAIVGGGFLGLELARQLRAAGNEVTLFDAAPHFGGLADAWQVGDITWDRHYHVTLLSDTRLRALLEDLNLADQLNWVETKTGFYTDGKLVSMSNSVEFLKFPPLRLLDKFRLGFTIFYASKIKNWKRLETVSVAEWLRKWSGKRTTEKIWIPLLKAKLGENYQHASAAFIWAIIARMYAARRSGLKKEMFGYVRGGYARVLDAFVKSLAEAGVTLRPGTPVQTVERVNDELAVTTASGETLPFDKVIITAAAQQAVRLCPGFTPVERDQHSALRYQGIVCASLVLKKPLANYYVTNITETWVPFTAVIEMTTLVNPAEFGGQHLVYLPKYVDPTDPLFEASDEVIRESFVTALAKMYPDFKTDDVLAFKVSRVRHVLAISTINYSANLPPMTTSVPGLSLVNSSQIVNGTLNVNETLMLADRAMTLLQAEVRS
ncbi:NAD(P)/FAD-dependent oxidoreductase [soil metagenome]